MVFGFVILHYMDLEVTKKCIDKVLNIKLNGNQVKIVIVDNASPNGSGEKLRRLMEKEKNVFVICSKKNLGFASGNNLGYRFLKEKFAIDFAIVINNDIFIDDNLILDKIENEFLKSGFDVLGPDIISLTSFKHQNPAHEKEFTIKELKEIKRKNDKFIRYYTFYKMRSSLKKLFFNKFQDKRPAKSSNKYEKNKRVNVVLHGSCYIMSRNFIKENDLLFYNKTFMYFEEDIFFFICSKKGYKIVYTPGIKVFHVEDVATNLSQKNSEEKKLYKIKLMNNSIDELIRLKTEEIKNEN
ncbi:glycosyltransferase [Liquorilactobacillus mali]|uniref:glycosyltransferase n=1 Tax=Liquorilactobacillus mali TaxID=1618 RepID=UPI000249168F|nr:glycosyltransferase [Liquorilactobacillus mali]QFQ74441.1 glycosyltransferase [Liquorilactobacillus mali]